MEEQHRVPNLFAKIAQDREERTKNLHLDLPIPTWDGDLVARFKVIPRPEMESFVNKKRNVETDIDFLVRCLDSVWVKDADKTIVSGTRMEENPEYVQVVDDDTGEPIGLDFRFAEKIGMPGSEEEKERVRNVVLYTFKNNGIAIGGFVGRLVQWLQNTDADVTGAIVGE